MVNIIRANHYTPTYRRDMNIPRYWRNKKDSCIWIEIERQTHDVTTGARRVVYRNATDMKGFIPKEDIPTYSMSYQELVDGFDRGPSRSDKF